MKKIKVGIIQQSNTADIRVNLMNLAKSIEACAAHGAQLIVLQELNPFPDHPQAFIPSWQPPIKQSLSPLFLRNVPPDYIITPLLCSTATEALRVNTGKCIFPMIRLTTKNSISLPETSVLNLFKPL